MEDLAKDGGLFDSKYEAHRVTSSRRRDFQTEVARAESSCLPTDLQTDRREVDTIGVAESGEKFDVRAGSAPAIEEPRT